MRGRVFFRGARRPEVLADVHEIREQGDAFVVEMDGQSLVYEKSRISYIQVVWDA